MWSCPGPGSGKLRTSKARVSVLGNATIHHHGGIRIGSNESTCWTTVSSHVRDKKSPHNGTCCCVAHHTPHDQLSNIKKAPQLRKLIAAQQLPTTKQKCKHAAGLTCSTSLPDAWMELAWVLPSFLSVFPILRSPLAHGPPFRAARGNTQHTAPLACEFKNYPWRVCVGVHM